MRARLIVGAVLVAVVALGAPAGAATSPEKADAALDRALAAFVSDADGPPGIAVVVQRDATPVLHEAGTAVAGTETPIQLSDHVRVASVAKAFSGAVALSLVASGELSLDDTVGETVPGQPAAWSAVTLRQLLQHTSGIPDFSDSDDFREALVESLQVAPPPAQLLSYVSDEPLSFAPGSRYKYSNSDNTMVGLMVESVTGRRYADVLQERVAVPFALGGTSLPADSALPTPYVHGYDISSEDAPEDVSTVVAAGWSWASGGVVSTPADASTFVRGYAAGKTTDTRTRVAQRAWVKGGSEPPGPGSMSAGLALFRYRTRCGTVYGHTGNTLGYTAFIAATGKGARSVAVAVNAQVTPKNNAERFPGLRRIFELGVCAALA